MAIGSGYTTFEGHDGAALRAAIATATTHHHGTFHPTGAQLGTFRQQLRKYGRDARANLGGRRFVAMGPAATWATRGTAASWLVIARRCS